MRISDWSSDVCSSDLTARRSRLRGPARAGTRRACVGLALAPAPGRTRMPGAGTGRRDPQLRHQRHHRLGRVRPADPGRGDRSEEHTSELQSLMRISYAVFCLKKKKSYNIIKDPLDKLICNYK